MNSNRSSNQGQGKANGKNRPKTNQKKRNAAGPPAAPQPPRKRQKRQESAAVAYATGQTGKGATVQASRDMCRVTHREFIGNVTGSTAFAIAAQFSLNPGLVASFPWLSGIAQNWETYRFRRLRLCFYTRTGTNVPGSVIMAHDPDASDAAPATEQVMTTYESVEEDAPWKDICLEMRPSSLHDLGPRKFVRTGALAANQDIKLYDSGNVFIGTVDGTAVSWGKLWFEYDIELYTPQLPPAGIPPLAGTLYSAAGTGGTTAALLGTAAVAAGSVGLSVVNNVVTMTNLVVGAEYQSVLNVGGATVTGALTQTFSAGATVKTLIISNGGNAGGFAASTASSVSTFTATAATATITMGGVTVYTTPSVGLLVVTQIPALAI